jgi:hypothetical protein
VLTLPLLPIVPVLPPAVLTRRSTGRGESVACFLVHRGPRRLTLRYMPKMKKQIWAVLAFFVCLPSWGSEHKCKEHGNFLVIKERGFEHVNHTLLVNGKTPVKELEEAMWFVETVKCTATGFEIEASHRQYNDPTKQTFVLKITDPSKYEVK